VVLHVPWKYQRRQVTVRVMTRTAAKMTSMMDMTRTTESMNRFILGVEEGREGGREGGRKGGHE